MDFSMSKVFLRSKTTLWSLVVFFASMALISILYFGWLNVAAAAPQVTFTRDGNVITANLTVATNNELKFLRDTSNSQYWDYGLVSTAADCKQTSFVDNGNAMRTGDTNVVTFTHPSSITSDQYFCLKVLYGRTNTQQFTEKYVAFLFDVTAPVITVEQNGLTLNAESNDSSGINDWTVETSATTTDCSSTPYSSSVDTSLANIKTVTLTTNDNGEWYCFRATDKQGNIGYSQAYQVDTVAPTLTITQVADSAIVTISVSQDNNNAGNADIDVDSWQYVQSTQTCSDAITSNWRDISTLSDDSNQDRTIVTFTRRNTGQTYCFRVSDSAANYAYAQHEVGTINEAPIVNRLSQTRSLVTAAAYDAQYLNTNSWQYTIANSDVCNSSLSDWQGLEVNGFSVNTRGEATLDLKLVSVDENSQNKWLCFRISDNIASNYGYRSIDVDADSPNINVRQNNAVLSASAGSSEGAVSSTWAFVKNSNNFTCNEDAFELYTPVRRGKSVSLTSADTGDYFCFRVSDRYDNFGYNSPAYRVRSLDTVAPNISAVQSNKSLTVSAAAGEDVDHDTWGYIDGFSAQVDCEDYNANLYDDIENRVIDLDEGDIGDWFCIRAADQAGNYGYLSIRVKAVDATAPVISVNLENNILRATTSADDIDVNTWQYAVSTANDRFSCASSNTNLRFNTASKDNARVTLTSADDNKYYCFRVADKAGNHGYARSTQVRNIKTAPVIVVKQLTAEKRLEISTSATDVDGLTWGWSVFNNDPGNCANVDYTNIDHSQITQNTRRIFVNNIAPTQSGSYYCFRVADTSTIYGTNYGYAKHRYDLTPPVIKFSLLNNILTISSDSTDIDATTWRYAQFKGDQTNCSQKDINKAAPTANRLRLREVDNNSYLCFKVADTAGNVGYGVYVVKGISNDNTPVIDITQTKLVVIATSADGDLDSASWRYALTASEPHCGLNNNLTFVHKVSSPNEVDLTSVDEDLNWICFRVSDAAGNVGYAKIKIDRKAPTLTITQNNVTLDVESVDTDLNESTWGYAKNSEDFECDDETSFSKLDFSSSKISFDLTTADNNKYYCFRVADKVGNFGYKKAQINPINLSAPVISVKQSNTVLTVHALNVDNSTWQYIRSTADLNCSATGSLSFNAASVNNQRIQLSEADNDTWFCFKVIGLNKKASYAKILISNVDSQKPEIKIAQQEETLIATANEEIKTWQYVALASSTANCSADAFADESKIKSGNEVTLTSADDAMTYCFRATDRAGNTSYKHLKVSIKASTEETEDNTDTTSEEGDDKVKDENTVEDEDDEGLLTGRNILFAGIALVAAIALVAIVVDLVKKSKDDDDDDDYNDM